MIRFTAIAAPTQSGWTSSDDLSIGNGYTTGHGSNGQNGVKGANGMAEAPRATLHGITLNGAPSMTAR